MNNEEYGIIETINFSRFCDSFPSSYTDNFSYYGKRALYDYIENYANELDKNIELDPMAWCCEFTEYDSAYQAMQAYKSEDMPIVGKDGNDLTEIAEKEEEAALAWLKYNTTVIEVDGGHIIIQNF